MEMVDVLHDFFGILVAIINLTRQRQIVLLRPIGFSIHPQSLTLL